MTTTATYGEERTGYVEPAWRPRPTEREMTPEEMFEAGLLRAGKLEALWMAEEEFGEGELAA